MLSKTTLYGGPLLLILLHLIRLLLSCSGQELPEVTVIPLAESGRVASVEGTHEVLELGEAKMT